MGDKFLATALRERGEQLLCDPDATSSEIVTLAEDITLAFANAVRSGYLTDALEITPKGRTALLAGVDILETLQ